MCCPLHQRVVVYWKPPWESNPDLQGRNLPCCSLHQGAILDAHLGIKPRLPPSEGGVLFVAPAGDGGRQWIRTIRPYDRRWVSNPVRRLDRTFRIGLRSASRLRGMTTQSRVGLHSAPQPTATALNLHASQW